MLSTNESVSSLVLHYRAYAYQEDITRSICKLKHTKLPKLTI